MQAPSDAYFVGKEPAIKRWLIALWMLALLSGCGSLQQTSARTSGIATESNAPFATDALRASLWRIALAGSHANAWQWRSGVWLAPCHALPDVSDPQFTVDLVQAQSKQRVRAFLVAHWPERDACVLSLQSREFVSRLFSELWGRGASIMNELPAGQSVWAAAYSIDQQLRLSHGQVRAMRCSPTGQLCLIEHTAATAPGDSGGLLLTQSGAIVGMLALREKREKGELSLSYAVWLSPTCIEHGAACKK